MYQDMLRAALLESSLAGKDLGILVNIRSNMSQGFALATMTALDKTLTADQGRRPFPST